MRGYVYTGGLYPGQYSLLLSDLAVSNMTLSVTADLDGDGTYETDFTGYIELPGSGLRTDRGLGPADKPKVSQLNLDLCNRSGDFTPEYSIGAFNGKIRPYVPVRIIITHNSIDYTLWTGYLVQTNFVWQRGAVAMAPFTAQDLFGVLQTGLPINVTASTTRRTDQGISAIATAAGLAGGDLSLGTGVLTMPMHFVINGNAVSAMMDVVASEMGGIIYINALGQITFEARNNRLGTTPSQTWGDGTTIYPNRVEYQFDPTQYVTSVTARGTHFLTGQDGARVFMFSQNMFTRPSASSMALTAGQVWTRTFQAAGAYIALDAPVAGSDYSANDAQNGTGTDRTSSLGVTVADLGGGQFTLTLTNNYSGTIYVTWFQIRGQSTNFYADRPQAIMAKSVPGLKAGQGVQFDLPFSGDTGQKLRDYAYQELRVGRYPYPMLVLTFDCSTDAKRVAMLSLELGQRILYKDTSITTKSANVNDWWYVEGIQYNLRPDWGHVQLQCTVTLSPTFVYRDLDNIAYDDFGRANVSGSLGTSLSDKVWASASGCDISSNAARANSDTLQMPTLSIGKSDQVCEASFAAIGAGDEVGLTFRYTDANNQYRAYFVQGTNLLKLEKNVAGVVTQIGASVAYTVGTTAEMRVLIQSTRIRVMVDKKMLIDTTDSALATGNLFGPFLRNANGTTTVDDVYGEGL